jgi:HK97 gp10 family phage protein
VSLSDNPNVTVKGEENLRRTLDAAEKNIARLPGDKQAGIVASRARGFAPVRTGRLRRSIKARRGPGGVGGHVEVGAPYGYYVENGTRHMRGRFYMKRAVEASGAQVVVVYKGQCQDELDKVRGA